MYLSSGVDIESFHSEIASKKNLPTQCASSEGLYLYRAYNQLVFLFVSVINEIQNGPVSNVHLNLSKQLTNEDAIITFNWDTLMDRALNESTNWCVDSGYGVSPKKIYRCGWVDPIKDGIQAPKLIKLHGSTNWLTSHTIPNDHGSVDFTHVGSPDLLYIYEDTNIPYPCYDGRYMPGYSPYSYGYYPPNLIGVESKRAPEGWKVVSFKYRFPWVEKGGADSSGLVSMPLIIPPVQKKEYDFFGKLFKILWLEAEAQLIQAEKIIIIGYSFPETDKQSRQLFLNAFSKRKTIPEVIIIDPRPDRINEIFAMEFGIPSSKITIEDKCFDENLIIEKYM